MLKVYSADHSDIEWITQLYIESAREKHFNLDTSDDASICFIQRNIESMVNDQLLVDFNLETQTLVFEATGQRIGYAVLSAVKGDPDSVEIHLLVVDQHYRGHSYGRYMLDEIIKRWHHNVNIYARCYPASWLMMEMLLHSGFSYMTELHDSSRLYVLPQTHVNQLCDLATDTHTDAPLLAT